MNLQLQTRTETPACPLVTEGLEGLGNSDWNNIPRSLMAPKGAGGYMLVYTHLLIDGI